MAYEKKRDGRFWHPAYGRVMEHDGYALRISWSQQMMDDMRRMYPTTINDELAGYLGVSKRTMIRKARELGLEKDPKWLSAIWEERRQWARMASAAKGYPGGFRKGEHASPEYEFKPGHRPTEEVREKQAAARRRFNLLNPEKLKERARKAAETRKRNKQNRDL